MDTDDYGNIIFLHGVQVSNAFKRDLERTKLLTDENLEKIIDFMIENYLTDSNIDENEIVEFAKLLDIPSKELERSINFFYFVFKCAIREKETVEDFEKDLINLGLTNQKGKFINKYSINKDRLIEKENEKPFYYMPQFYDSEWKISKTVAVSTGKISQNVSIIVNIEYSNFDGETKKISMETNVPKLRALISDLNYCLKEAETWQKEILVK